MNGSPCLLSSCSACTVHNNDDATRLSCFLFAHRTGKAERAGKTGAERLAHQIGGRGRRQDVDCIGCAKKNKYSAAIVVEVVSSASGWWRVRWCFLND